MTTIEKLDAIPKVVSVHKDLLNDPDWDANCGDNGFAVFTLDLNIHDEGARLSYYQETDDEYYELWHVSARTYENDGERLLYGTVGHCLERCLDETIKHFHEHRNEYSSIETYSGYSYDD